MKRREGKKKSQQWKRGEVEEMGGTEEKRSGEIGQRGEAQRILSWGKRV